MVAHLSEAVASGLTGIGHSTAYKEDQSYSLAVRYLFETTPSKAAPGTLEVDEFLATEATNSYEIPWCMRGVMEDPLVLELFGSELTLLRRKFEDWQPVTARMKDLRRKVSPILISASISRPHPRTQLNRVEAHMIPLFSLAARAPPLTAVSPIRPICSCHEHGSTSGDQPQSDRRRYVEPQTLIFVRFSTMTDREGVGWRQGRD